MEKNMKGNIKMIRNMDMVYLNLQMAENIVDFGKMDYRMVKGNFSDKMDNQQKVFGIKVD